MTPSLMRMVPPGATIVEREPLIEMLQSGVAWLEMLGALRDAVRDEDWDRALRLAQERITYPQPYPER